MLRERGLAGADCVISGIPFSTIPEPQREEILRSTHAALRPGGAFLVYQFSPRVLADLRRIFSRVTQSFEPLNVLPAQIFPPRAATAGRLSAPARTGRAPARRGPLAPPAPTRPPSTARSRGRRRGARRR